MHAPARRIRWTWLRLEELIEVLQAAREPRLRSVVAVAAFTGLRRGELWGLTWDAVDLDRGVVAVRQAVGERRRIQVPKNGRAREVPLLAPARAALLGWQAVAPRSPRGYVWPARDGGPHHPDYDAGLRELQRDHAEDWRPFRFHDLRHTCASWLVQGTLAPALVERPMRLEEVQLWLGHSSRLVTERYAHLCPDGIRAVVRTLPGPAPVDQRWTKEPPEARGQKRSKAERSRNGGPCGGRTHDRRVKSAEASGEILAETVAIPMALVHRLVRLRDELRNAVEARDPLAVHRALDLGDGVDEIEEVAIDVRSRLTSPGPRSRC